MMKNKPTQKPTPTPAFIVILLAPGVPVGVAKGVASCANSGAAPETLWRRPWCALDGSANPTTAHEPAVALHFEAMNKPTFGSDLGCDGFGD